MNTVTLSRAHEVPELLQDTVFTTDTGVVLMFVREEYSSVSVIGKRSIHPLVHVTVMKEYGQELTLSDIGMPAHRFMELLKSQAVRMVLGKKYLPMCSDSDIKGAGWKVAYRCCGLTPRTVEFHIAFGDPQLVSALTDDMFFNINK